VDSIIAQQLLRQDFFNSLSQQETLCENSFDLPIRRVPR
jgi:hypothetical protein